MDDHSKVLNSSMVQLQGLGPLCRPQVLTEQGTRGEGHGGV